MHIELGVGAVRDATTTRGRSSVLSQRSAVRNYE